MATTRKKSTTRKKTASRKTAAKKTAAPQAKARGAKSAVKIERAPEVSLESRLLAPLAELESLLERFRKSQWPNPFAWDWPPAPDFKGFFEGRPPSVDIIDSDTHIIARAEVPGVDKDDLEVNVSDRLLTIRGKTRHEERKTEGDIQRREIRAGAFSRTMTLPDAVDGRRAKATYRDGVLELKLPKLKRSKRHDVRID
jgi:HSP20 family protein